MIKTINLQKIFKTEEVETWALNNVSVEVKEVENLLFSIFSVYWIILQEESII